MKKEKKGQQKSEEKKQSAGTKPGASAPQGKKGRKGKIPSPEEIESVGVPLGQIGAGMPKVMRDKNHILFQHIRELTDKETYRRQTGEFVTESEKLLVEACRFGAWVNLAVWQEDARICVQGTAIRHVRVTRDVMASISHSPCPPSVLFICRRRDLPLPQKLDGSRYLLLDNIQDPGNVGTILRSADAFACDGVFLLGGCASPFNSKTARASMGAVFRANYWQCTLEQAAALLSDAHIPLYGAALHGEPEDARTAAKRSPLAIAIGHEGRGLSDEVLSRCSGTLRLPMVPRSESLNAAVAASILLWEMYNDTELSHELSHCEGHTDRAVPVAETEVQEDETERSSSAPQNDVRRKAEELGITVHISEKGKE